MLQGSFSVAASLFYGSAARSHVSACVSCCCRLIVVPHHCCQRFERTPSACRPNRRILRSDLASYVRHTRQSGFARSAANSRVRGAGGILTDGARSAATSSKKGRMGVRPSRSCCAAPSGDTGFLNHPCAFWLHRHQVAAACCLQNALASNYTQWVDVVRTTQQERSEQPGSLF